MSGWIDIKKEMPPEGKNVVIVYDCCGEPEIDIMMRKPVRLLGNQHENAFIGTRGFLTDDVTHWMKLGPLPDMYKKP